MRQKRVEWEGNGVRLQYLNAAWWPSRCPGDFSACRDKGWLSHRFQPLPLPAFSLDLIRMGLFGFFPKLGKRTSPLAFETADVGGEEDLESALDCTLLAWHTLAAARDEG